ncbi:hypothetical protein O3P69_000788 [Scylla paramamosain]|uniref:Uncharacterized protein n=1 Tax=Scylla paramamosain TaxID=85552 RepID=A0AAW0URD3_SCYPA
MEKKSLSSTIKELLDPFSSSSLRCDGKWTHPQLPVVDVDSPIHGIILAGEKSPLPPPPRWKERLRGSTTPEIKLN